MKKKFLFSFSFLVFRSFRSGPVRFRWFLVLFCLAWEDWRTKGKGICIYTYYTSIYMFIVLYYMHCVSQAFAKNAKHVCSFGREISKTKKVTTTIMGNPCGENPLYNILRDNDYNCWNSAAKDCNLALGKVKANNPLSGPKWTRRIAIFMHFADFKPFFFYSV